MLCTLTLGLLPQADDTPLTAAESSSYERTSTHAEVLEFLDALAPLPHAERLFVGQMGASEEGRALPLVVVSEPPQHHPDELRDDQRLVALINANIHGGEVEGKEVVQALLRELALGEHAELLEHLVLLFVPVYNADGNDRIERSNRATQNGPVDGVGERANAGGLDLNRDFIKAESAECRALLGVMNAWDPHLFMDLHTTNGSYHGYHLTYSPSLSTNVDPALDAYARQELLPAVRSAMQADHRLRVFDYGNFSGEAGARLWSTYDHRPRFGTNYYGLRNRLAVLSEAYSYIDFETRVVATRAFVLEVLRALASQRERVRLLCAAADARLSANPRAVQFGWQSELAPPVTTEVLIGAIDELELGDELGVRRRAREEFTVEPVGVRDAFVSQAREGLPIGWILPAPDARVRELLALHGLESQLLRSPATLPVRYLAVQEMQRGRRLFQGHHEVSLRGVWNSAERVLPAGSLFVPAAQPRGRVAAQLLHPMSEDSLATWNYFEHATDESGEHPALEVDLGDLGALRPHLEPR